MVSIYAIYQIQGRLKQKGIMCTFDDSFTFEDLKKWVKRNCRAYGKIKIVEDEYILLGYMENDRVFRTEKYYLKKTIKAKDNKIMEI